MANPVCPINCDANLPAWNFSDCNPQINLSEVRRLFFAKTTAAPFNDWTDATEWMARLSQTSTSNDDVIRSLDVIGDLPAGSQVVKDISKRRKVTISKDRTLPFTIDDVSQENYEAARVWECNALYKWWFETEGGFMYGGNDGFNANVAIDLILGRGADSAEELQGSLSWRAKFMPERTLSPIYDSTSGGVITFDTLFSFTSSNEAGPTGGVSAIIDNDPDVTDTTKKFEFNAKAIAGTPQTMTLYVGGIDSDHFEMAVDFPGTYLSEAFKFTDHAGVVHNGTFVTGDRNFA